MALEFEIPDGATPLEPEELEQLIPPQITTMGQLNEAEQLNVAAAGLWALGRRRHQVLNLRFTRSLHKRMFGDVWRWAGEFRQRAVNIGNVEAHEISVRLLQLFDNVKHWAAEDVYPPDETACRLHHGLTVIHAFPNGNGRHARLMTDVFLKSLDRPAFTWGGGDLAQTGDAREGYLAALRAADGHDLAPLVGFVRG